MTDLLCMGVHDFAEIVAEKAERLDEREGEDLRVVIGTPIEYRPFEELQQDAEFSEGEPSMFTEDMEPEEGDDLVRVGDFVYPSWAFDDSGVDILEEADSQLFGTVLLEESLLDIPHYAALTIEQYATLVSELAEEYGEDYAVITGLFSPEGTWQITDGGSVKRAGCLHFPGTLFKETGISDVKNSKTAWSGAQIVPIDALSSDVREQCIENDGVATNDEVEA